MRKSEYRLELHRSIADELATFRALNKALAGPLIFSDADRERLVDARATALLRLRSALDQLHPKSQTPRTPQPCTNPN